MKKNVKRLLCLFLCFLIMGVFTVMEITVPLVNAAAATIEPVPNTSNEPLSDFILAADGTNIPVIFDSNNNYHYANFSYSSNDTTTLVVTVPNNITSYNISPENYGITGTVSNNTLSFDITGQKYLIVKINNYKDLVILADSLEVNPPGSSDSNVINVSTYSGVDSTGQTDSTAGINQAITDAFNSSTQKIVYIPSGLYRSGTVRMKAGVTLYLARGSVLKATDTGTDFSRSPHSSLYNRRIFIDVYEAHGAKIKGRGVIDGNGHFLRNIYSWPGCTIVGRSGDVDCDRVNMVVVQKTKGFEINGVTSKNGQSWNTYVFDSEDVLIKNYKILGLFNFKENDGIDLDSSHNVMLDSNFIRTRDDAICLKALGTYNGVAISPDGTVSDAYNYKIKNNVIWTETIAFKFGRNESQSSNVYNMLFDNNTVINARSGINLISYGGAEIYDWTFQNNHYENTYERNIYIETDGKFNNINYVNETFKKFGPYNSVIKGTNHHFYDLNIAGAIRTTANDAHFTDQSTNLLFFTDTLPPQPMTPPEMLLDENFNNGVTGTPPEGWTMNTSGGTVTVEEVPNFMDKSLNFNDTSSSHYIAAVKSFADRSGTLRTEFKAKASQTTAISGFSIRGSSSQNALTVAFDTNGYIYTYNGSVKVNLATYMPDTWYEFRIEANTETDTFDIYIDDQNIAMNLNFRNAAASLNNVYINSGSSSTGSHDYDNIKVTKPLFEDNFNNGTAGSAPEGWTVTPDMVTVEDIPSSSDKSMRINDTSSSQMVEANKEFTPQTGIITLDFEAMASQTNTVKGMSILGDAGPIAVTIAFDSNGYIYTYYGSTKTNIQTYSIDTWYSFRIVADPLTNTFDLYIDDMGTKKVDGQSFRNGVSKLGAIYMNTSSSGTGSMFINNLEIKN